MTTQPEDAVGVFPVPRACPFSLPPEYERLRSGGRAVRARMAGGTRRGWSRGTRTRARSSAIRG
ncbi:hypothetical protein ACFQY7_13075 [Actinomadura luteofluorescens]|uniref:hypothetical protein n=1 Tax=Actinomadura luteofluorescens TaxID=46163 RepID=UPI00362C02A6